MRVSRRRLGSELTSCLYVGRFETSEDLDRWKDSPEFQKLVGTVREEGLLVEKTDVFVLGEVIEGFFPEEQEEEEAGDVER